MTTITDREQLRPGDYATFEYTDPDDESKTLTLAGHLRRGPLGSLFLGLAEVVYSPVSGWNVDYRFISADRPLPAEAGEVIVVTGAFGAPLDTPVRAMRTVTGCWRVAAPVRGESLLYDKEISDWRPVKTVEEA